MSSVLLILAAAIMKAIMDVLNFHSNLSIFPKSWATAESWRNKWKNGDQKQGEKFPLSSTVLVFTTDAWHLAQFFQISFIMAAIVSYRSIVNRGIDFLILHVLYTGTFELFFSRVFIKKK